MTPVAKVEYEARIADHFASEAGRSNVTLAKKFFYLSKQMHLLFLITQRDSAGHSFPMQFLLV